MHGFPLRLLQLIVTANVLIGCLDPGADAPCPEGLSCVEPTPCAVDADCDDGIFCNGLEVCDAGQGCLAGTSPACDDGLSCTADACDETYDACSFTPTVAAPGAPEPLASDAGAIRWTTVTLADGATPTYDLVIDDSCDADDREACGMESPEIEARDVSGAAFADPDGAALPTGSTFRVRACHPCTGECGPWSEGAEVL
jgi:hypothetical protein